MGVHHTGWSRPEIYRSRVLSDSFSAAVRHVSFHPLMCRMSVHYTGWNRPGIYRSHVLRETERDSDLKVSILF